MSVHDAVKSLVIKAVEDEFDRQSEFGYTPGAEDLKLVIDDCMREADIKLESVSRQIAIEEQNPSETARAVSTQIRGAIRAIDPTKVDQAVEFETQEITQEIALGHARLVSQMKDVWPHENRRDRINDIVREEGFVWQVVWNVCLLLEDSPCSEFSALYYFEHIGQDIYVEIEVPFISMHTLEESALDLLMAMNAVFKMSDGGKEAGLAEPTREQITSLDQCLRRLAVVLLKEEEESEEE